MPIGFTLPFSKSSGSVGYFETTSDEMSATRENLKSLLLTNWGERAMHYNFGCNFKEFLFENVHQDELKSRIADRVASQVEMWMPFVSVTNLDVLFAEDDANVPENAVQVKIEFRLDSRPDLKSRLDIIVSQ